jgi:hypothetical protein
MNILGRVRDRAYGAYSMESDIIGWLVKLMIAIFYGICFTIIIRGIKYIAVDLQRYVIDDDIKREDIEKCDREADKEYAACILVTKISVGFLALVFLIYCVIVACVSVNIVEEILKKDGVFLIISMIVVVICLLKTYIYCQNYKGNDKNRRIWLIGSIVSLIVLTFIFSKSSKVDLKWEDIIVIILTMVLCLLAIHKYIKYILKIIKKENMIIFFTFFSILIIGFFVWYITLLSVLVSCGSVDVEFGQNGRIMIDQTTNYKADITIEIYAKSLEQQGFLVSNLTQGDELDYAEAGIFIVDNNEVESVWMKSVKLFSYYEYNLLEDIELWNEGEMGQNTYIIKIAIKIGNKKVHIKNEFNFEDNKFIFLEERIKMEY